MDDDLLLVVLLPFRRAFVTVAIGVGVGIGRNLESLPRELEEAVRDNE